jgi:hypothetical protein
MAIIFHTPWADFGAGLTPSAGAQLFFFDTGTAVQKPVYVDQAITTPYTQPVVADALGVFPVIWLQGDYKVQLLDENDVQIRETDPIGSFASGGPIQSGDKMFFQQTTAPLGWTKDLSHDNKALRLVNDTVSTGGSLDFTTVFASQAVAGTNANTAETGSVTVNNHTLTVSEMPSHNHSMGSVWSSTANEASTIGPDYDPSDKDGRVTTEVNSGGDAGHDHTATFVGDSHTHTFSGTAIDLDILYVDVILCTRD